MNINVLAKQVFEENKARGWWDNMDRDIHQTLMLVVTEIAEATEGVRRDRMDDHLPHRKQEEVELADTLIRLLDLAGRYNWKLQNVAVIPTLFNYYRDKDMPPAAEHFALVEEVVKLAKKFSIYGAGCPEAVDQEYTALVAGIYRICTARGFDIGAAVAEKLEYNRNRADHKREARAAPGGKGF